MADGAGGGGRTAGIGRIGLVTASVEGRIASRSLGPGARLPSVRAQAETLGVSRSTVVEAYDRLVAAGVIVSRPGSGFYVAGRTAPLALADLAPRLDRSVDPLWVSRQSLEASEDVAKPGCGWLPASWLPEEALRKALRAAARGPAEALTDYAVPLGHPGLRALVARRSEERGVPARAEATMLTESGTQALDLVCRFLLEPGDAVLVDDPCYFNFHALLRAHRARAVGVPMTPAGPDPEAFGAAVAAHRPRLYLTNSALHNPTGASLTPAVAHRVLTICEQAAVTIVEDDIFADFERVASPRLAALDGLRRVVQVGSFSKTLSASIRCGWVSARADWIEALADLRIATAFGGGRFHAEVVHAVMIDGSYRRHVEALRRRLDRARAKVARDLGRLGLVPWTEPTGGLFLWCRLPEGLAAAAVAQRALAEGVVLAPGDAFSPSGRGADFLRFNVAQSGDPRVVPVLARAMAG